MILTITMRDHQNPEVKRLDDVREEVGSILQALQRAAHHRQAGVAAGVTGVRWDCRLEHEDGRRVLSIDSNLRIVSIAANRPQVVSPVVAAQYMTAMIA